MTMIVAGVDGSTSAVNAAVWAAGEAVLRQETLRLVHAYVVPLQGYPSFVATPHEVRKGLDHQGQEWLQQAQDAVERAVPGVRVETGLGEGDAATALLHESRAARVVVVGSRGLGGFTGMLIGSAAMALVSHGHCPVVVVRGRQRDGPPSATGPITVGLDGSAASDTALGFAFDQADLRKASLVAVRVWNDTGFDLGPRGLRPSVDPTGIDRAERTALDEQLAGWRDRYPDVTVEPVVARGRTVHTLLEYGEQAQLMVVGSRGRGGFTGMLLGSTSRALVIHSSCPIAVMHAAGSSDGDRSNSAAAV